METIFDYKPTDDEWEEIFGGISKDEARADFLHDSNDSRLYPIGLLHRLRGDSESLDSIIDRISSIDMRRQLLMTDCITAGRALSRALASEENRKAA